MSLHLIVKKGRQEIDGGEHKLGYCEFLSMKLDVLEAIESGLSDFFYMALGVGDFSELKFNDDKKIRELFYGKISKMADIGLTAILYYRKYRGICDDFIYHSDCEGKITAGKAKRLIKEFERLDFKPRGCIENGYRGFLRVLKVAADNNAALIFL